MDIERYAREGKQIVDTYCKSDEANEPMMCPPAPNLSPYIDKFQGQLSTGNQDDQQHQEDYEAEVKVYRALEGLKEDICVLHSFDYTHGQYQLFVGDHVSTAIKTKGKPCNKQCTATEGECDFLVIGRNYLVIIEVKNMKSVEGEPGCNREKHIKALAGTFNKSQEQCAKTKTLIDSIIDRVGGDKDTPILHFSAFPNFKKEFIDEFELDEEKKKGIICREDLDYFDKWWKDNVPYHDSDTVTDLDHDSVSHPVDVSCLDWLLQTVCCGRRESSQPDNSSVSHPDSDSCRMINSALSHVLLALWCCEPKKKSEYWFNKPKFSLQKCIKDTDEKLRNAKFTQERKKATARAQFKNPAVDPAPQIFKYLGVQNLTKKQQQAFSSNQKLLFINGPAGSGKTIIILGKIIELAKAEPDKKIIVIKPSPSPHYLETLRKAGVTCTEISLEQYDLNKDNFKSHQYVKQLISPHTEQVVIIQRITDSDWFTARELENMCGIITNVADACHVFIDDSQVLFRRNSSFFHQVLAALLTKLSARPTAPTPSTVWWAGDIVQVAVLYTTGIADYSDTLHSVLTSKQLITLSDNLRNTCDISKMVSAVRDNFIELTGTRTDDRLVPHEDNGHFIHGPRPIIHVVYDNAKERVSHIVEKELKKLCDSDSGEHNIGLIVDHRVRGATADRLRELDTVTRNPCIEVVSGLADESYSVEWPAVLVVAELEEDSSGVYDWWLSQMYVLLSRGRVYCSAVLIARPKQRNNKLLDRLKHVARIKYYK